VKSSEVKNIKNMKKSAIKAGFLKKLGNKGYILYEFKYKNKTFSFGSGHLTAGENDKNYKNRTNLLIEENFGDNVKAMPRIEDSIRSPNDSSSKIDDKKIVLIED